MSPAAFLQYTALLRTPARLSLPLALVQNHSATPRHWLRVAFGSLLMEMRYVHHGASAEHVAGTLGGGVGGGGASGAGGGGWSPQLAKFVPRVQLVSVLETDVGSPPPVLSYMIQ